MGYYKCVSLSLNRDISPLPTGGTVPPPGILWHLIYNDLYEGRGGIYEGKSRGKNANQLVLK